MCKSKEMVIHIVGAALVLSFQYQLSDANVIGLGACPSLNPTIGGTDDPFAGGVATPPATLTKTWYLHRRFPSYHTGLTCVTFTFTTAQAAATFTNTATITGKKPLTGNTVSVTGTITQRTTDLAFWEAIFSGTNAHHLPTSITVAAYDNTNQGYLVLYSCKSYGFFNKQYSWLLTSSPSSGDTNIFAALDAVNTIGLPVSNYEIVSQNC